MQACSPVLLPSRQPSPCSLCSPFLFSSNTKLRDLALHNGGRDLTQRVRLHDASKWLKITHGSIAPPLSDIKGVFFFFPSGEAVLLTVHLVGCACACVRSHACMNSSRCRIGDARALARAMALYVCLYVGMSVYLSFSMSVGR